MELALEGILGEGSHTLLTFGSAWSLFAAEVEDQLIHLSPASGYNILREAMKA